VSNMKARLSQTLPAKLLLSLAAGLSCAWLLVGLSDETRYARGLTLLVGGNPAKLRTALGDLRSAQLLNFSLGPDQYEAVALWRLGDHGLAERKLRALLKREPENRYGWLVLANLLAADNPEQAAAALARAEQLDGKIAQPSK